MNLNNLDVDVLIKKIQKQVRQSKKSNKQEIVNVEPVPASSEIFDEMKKRPYTD